MGLLGAAMGLGMIFGPAIGGVFSRFGLQAPFAFSAALAAATLLAGVWLLPESLPGARGLGLRAVGAGGGPGPETAPAPAPARRVSRWALASGPLGLLFLLAFVVSFAIAGFESTFALYLNARLGTGSDQMGLIFTIMGVVAVVAQGFLVSRLIRRLGEDRVARLGLALSLAGMVLTTRLGSLGSAILFAAIFSLGNSLARPAVSTLVSRKTEVGQGAALGTMQSFDSLGRIAGPVWGGVAFRLYPGLPYWTGAAALGLALTASFVWAPLLAVWGAGGAEGMPR
ncbi:MAG: MFS transporter [Firmicutes bacterium]|nr:MFS transporter [Bacillota bacterium]